MANGALDSYLQVQLNNFDIANILENGWLDYKINKINLQNKSNLKKKHSTFSKCSDNLV